MEKVEHIGIAVRNIVHSNTLYTALLGVPPYKTETVESEHVITSFFKVGDTKIELLQATQADSPVARFIEQRGEGVHHIAYQVADIQQSMHQLVQEGFRLINQQPKKGADNKLVCFLHPKTSGGVLVELCQEITLL